VDTKHNIRNPNDSMSCVIVRPHVLCNYIGLSCCEIGDRTGCCKHNGARNWLFPASMNCVKIF
jgi:hypothetical protein